MGRAGPARTGRRGGGSEKRRGWVKVSRFAPWTAFDFAPIQRIGVQTGGRVRRSGKLPAGLKEANREIGAPGLKSPTFARGEWDEHGARGGRISSLCLPRFAGPVGPDAKH